MVARATAFGLDVESDFPLSFLKGSTAGPTGRTVGASASGEGQIRRDWPPSAALVCDERQLDGSVIFQIESHPHAGYLIAGPKHGTFGLSGDGRVLRWDAEGLPDGQWQRLLIAQVLPFAALLWGLEVFHASAVVWHARAVAFVGRSHAGKTSLALELCRGGAGFLADDVLALERSEERLLAHPGTPVASIALTQGAEDAAGHPREETVGVNEREHLVQVQGAAEPVPLAALFFLDRRSDGPATPRFEPAADARMLLSATFNFVLGTPERLCDLLEVCALAARLPVERIVCGPATSVSQLAAAVERRLAALP
jgi:hypothetical protein